MNELIRQRLDIEIKDQATSDLLDASIDGPGGEVFTGFKIVRRTLSDKSEVLDFELFEDQAMETILKAGQPPRVAAVCTACGKTKQPTAPYLRLLKANGQPYVCQSCRGGLPTPPMSVGKLGVM